jgi:peptidoglycan-N-acetylglucosamine deacetylase
MLDNVDNKLFRWERLRALLSDVPAQKKLAIKLRDYLLAKQYQGINVDFEPAYETWQPQEKEASSRLVRVALPRFMGILKTTFEPAHLLVTQDLPVSNDALNSYDYDALNDVNDFVIIMLYDQHTPGDDPGPIASQKWVEDVAERVFSKMDSSKVILGLDNRCYDWPVKYDKDAVPRATGMAKATLLGDALRIAGEASAPMEMDPDDLNPYFTYVDEDNTDHIVYILDAVTAYNEIVALKGYQPRGAALWYLGTEDPSIWHFLDDEKLDKAIKPSVLEKVKYQSQVNNESDSEGEIRQVVSRSKPGERALEEDEDGIVTSEKYIHYPCPYMVRRLGGDEPHLRKTLALTFDDGPDPVYTTEILRVLKQRKEHGTFFVVGANAEKYENVLRQTALDGNEIGNHTFTHPHITQVSPLRAEMEVNATQRIIESATGHATRLFRPPYGGEGGVDPTGFNLFQGMKWMVASATGNAKNVPWQTAGDAATDSADPNNPDLIRVMEQMQRLGYITVEMNIDPDDYSRPGKDTIVQRVIDQVEKDPKSHVILLHDGGGDRQQTVAALPEIIDKLRAKGYRFVTISQLIGKDFHENLFPAVMVGQERIIGLDRFVFEGGFQLSRILQIIFLLSILLGVSRVLITAPLALLQARRFRKQVDSHADFRPSVTVIIPGYNEEKVIARTISTALASDYPDLRVIVVDDGSTDDTAEVVHREFAHEPRVSFIRKENGGKASALNVGTAAATTEIVVCVDADTIIAKDAVAKLVRQFADPKVGAVAGNVKVGNRDNALTAWQSVEYITSQNFDRRAYAALNSVPVVPGALGAWRTSAVAEAGAYETDTLAEDTDLTFRVKLLGYEVRTDNEALAFTEAPDSVRTLAKQRFRWAYGILQALWKHRRAMFKRKHGAFGMVVMPAMWVYSILFQAFSPIVDLAVVITLVNHNVLPVLVYYAAFFVLDFFGSALAFWLDKENPKQLAWLFWQRFFYRQFMYYIILKSLAFALSGRHVGWGKLDRKATAVATTDAAT